MQRNITGVLSMESIMRARYGRMINPLCESTRSAGAEDEAILNDTVKSLLPGLLALALTLQFEAKKWQDQGLKCQGQGQCHDYQFQGPHCQV